MTWRTAALCADTVTSPADDLWFSDDPADITAAKAICRRCPSRRDCSQEATTRGLGGMWGGEIHEVQPEPPSDDIDEQMRDLYDRGYTDADIGKRVDMNREQVRNWRRRHGLRADRTNNPERLALYRKGHTDSYLAAIEGITRNAITAWRRRNNLPTNNPKRSAV